MNSLVREASKMQTLLTLSVRMVAIADRMERRPIASLRPHPQVQCGAGPADSDLHPPERGAGRDGVDACSSSDYFTADHPWSGLLCPGHRPPPPDQPYLRALQWNDDPLGAEGPSLLGISRWRDQHDLVG